jgi:uncharacterized membrane protein YfcA
MAILILVGLAAGILSGLLGIGGAILVIPALIIFLKYEPRQAAVTSLVALLLPVGAGALYRYFKAGSLSGLEVKSGLWIALGIFAGGIIGAELSAHLSQSGLQKAFSVLLVIVAIRLWMTSG